MCVLRRFSGGKAYEPVFSISMALQLAERLHLEVVKAIPLTPRRERRFPPALSVGLAKIGGKSSSPGHLPALAMGALLRAGRGVGAASSHGSAEAETVVSGSYSDFIRGKEMFMLRVARRDMRVFSPRSF
jgi:hypothetical protein